MVAHMVISSLNLCMHGNGLRDRGIVEICINSHWDRICSRDWGDNDVTCMWHVVYDSVDHGIMTHNMQQLHNNIIIILYAAYENKDSENKHQIE